MTESDTDQAFQRLVQRLDPSGTLLRNWELEGGVSAHITALEIEQPDGRTRKIIVRRHGAVDLRQNPHVAADEFRLLSILRSHGVTAPSPYNLDESGEILPTPYIVVEYVEGSVESAPSDLNELVFQLSKQLSGIHTIECSNADLSFLRRIEERYAARLRTQPALSDQTLWDARIRDTLQPIWPLSPRNPSVLLHGDYWPGNVLWRDGRLIAVIDWEDAGVGDPLADVANCRLELLWTFGPDAMRAFTQQYRSMTALDFTDLPYWDLIAAFRAAPAFPGWAANETAERTMRQKFRWFISQAFERLPAL